MPVVNFFTVIVLNAAGQCLQALTEMETVFAGYNAQGQLVLRDDFIGRYFPVSCQPLVGNRNRGNLHL
jgi:hypothetical protein